MFHLKTPFLSPLFPSGFGHYRESSGLFGKGLDWNLFPRHLKENAAIWPGLGDRWNLSWLFYVELNLLGSSRVIWASSFFFAPRIPLSCLVGDGHLKEHNGTKKTLYCSRWRNRKWSNTKSSKYPPPLRIVSSTRIIVCCPPNKPQVFDIPQYNGSV